MNPLLPLIAWASVVNIVGIWRRLLFPGNRLFRGLSNIPEDHSQ